MIRLVTLLLLIAPLGMGEDEKPAEDITIMLKAGVPSEKQRLGYSRVRPVVVESTVPRFLFEIPKLAAKDPLFFRVALGESKGLPFYGALDRSKTGDYHDLLYIDRNRDLDLTNDGPPIAAKITKSWRDDSRFIEFHGVTLEVPYSHEGAVVKVAYPCLIWFATASKKKNPITVQVERDGWRQGTVKVGGADYVFALVDDDCDGNYTTGDTWSFLPAGKQAEELLSQDSTRSMLFPGWSKDQKLTIEVKSVDLAGRRVTLRVLPAKETEEQFFLRVMRAQQTPEERQLKLDPRRPKTGKRDQVKWLKHKDGPKEALRIGNSPNVKKRVLLDFWGPKCVWCARMMKYTFQDREVVQLSEKFVCAKVPFTPGALATGKYQVNGTPTYIVLDLDGSEITRHEGWLRPAEFAAWLKSALR